jgi:hypothetical protein
VVELEAKQGHDQLRRQPQKIRLQRMGTRTVVVISRHALVGRPGRTRGIDAVGDGGPHRELGGEGDRVGDVRGGTQLVRGR